MEPNRKRLIVYRLTASTNHQPNCHFTVDVKEKHNIPTVCSGEDLNKSTTLPDNNGGAQGRSGGVPLISISGPFPSNLRSTAAE